MEQAGLTLELLKIVDAFYSQSFNKLIVVVSLLVGFLGFFFPIAITWYQSRKYKVERSEIESRLKVLIEAKFKDEIQAIHNSLDERVNQLVEEACSGLQHEVDIIKSQVGNQESKGRKQYLLSLFLNVLNEAERCFKQCDYERALGLYFKAAAYSLDLEKNENFFQIIESCYQCIDHLCQQEGATNLDELEKAYIGLMETVDKFNSKNVYTYHKEKITQYYQKLLGYY